MLDRILCGGFGLPAISSDDDAGINVASVVSFENPPAPGHPAAKGVFLETIPEVTVITRRLYPHLIHANLIPDAAALVAPVRADFSDKIMRPNKT